MNFGVVREGPWEKRRSDDAGPNPGSGPENLGLGQMCCFGRGLQLKIFTSGPNPWLWAQNHGFGPDVVLFSLVPAKSHHKNTNIKMAAA